MVIKARVGYNDYSNRFYCRTFFVENFLPTVGDEIDGVTVVKIDKCKIDFQQGNYKAYNYNYYVITTVDDEHEENEEYIAILKPDNEWVF